MSWIIDESALVFWHLFDNSYWMVHPALDARRQHLMGDIEVPIQWGQTK
jgi:hypothetical protein